MSNQNEPVITTPPRNLGKNHSEGNRESRFTLFIQECKVPLELLEDILLEVFSQEIHRVLVTRGSLSTHPYRTIQGCNPSCGDLDSNNEKAVMASAGFRAKDEKGLRTILNLLHTSRQVRLIVQKHLHTLCPVEFQEPDMKQLLPENYKGVLSHQITRYKLNQDAHWTLKSLYSLQGLAILCLVIDEIGCSPNSVVSYAVSGWIEDLSKREEACRTPLARIYLGWAHLRVMLHLAHSRPMVHTSIKVSEDVTSNIMTRSLTTVERRLLASGIADISFLNFHLELGMLYSHQLSSCRNHLITLLPAIGTKLLLIASSSIGEMVQSKTDSMMFFEALPKNNVRGWMGILFGEQNS
jgi:hypothetical protein